MENNDYILTQESFYVQGILIAIIEQYISFLHCKHRHMMKSGAPPDKVGSPIPSVIEFHGFTSKIDFLGLFLLG